MTTPLISVLIPFHGDNPLPLLEALVTQVKQDKLPVTFILGDDASPAGLPDDLAQRLTAEKEHSVLLRAPENWGRSAMRNRLAEAATGRYLLFLDADMLPDDPCFMERYISLCETGEPQIVFGGISLLQTPVRNETGLHRMLSLATECLNAKERNRNAPAHVFTSNLLVRRDIFLQCKFDEGFSGWGWEDIEWALRTGTRFDIRHVDNPATHLGLYNDEALVTRYENSLNNFRRLIQLHPHAVAEMRLTRLSRQLAALHLPTQLLRSLRMMALCRALPRKIRLFSFRLWRASLYAKAFERPSHRMAQPHAANT